MRHFPALFTLFLGFLFALPSQASVIRGGETVSIDQPSEENHYLAGGEIYVRAPIGGDVFAMGGSIEISAPVADDVMLAGGELILKAPIGGDLRVAGGEVSIEANIAGDLLIAGGEVTVHPGVLIGGDLLLMAGNLEFHGEVGGDARIMGGEIELEGGSLQALQARAGKLQINTVVRGPSSLVAEAIELGGEARFLGDVEYWSENGEIDFGPYLGEGASARLNPDLATERKDAGPGWMLPVYRFLAGALLIVLLVYFAPSFFRKHAGYVSQHLGSSFGYGAAYFILVPLLAIIAMVTIIGLPVGLIMLAGYGVSLLLGGALASVILAYELEKRQGRHWTTGKVILVAIGISLGIRLVSLIPVLGWLVVFFLLAVTFGYLYKVLSRKYTHPSNPDIV